MASAPHGWPPSTCTKKRSEVAMTVGEHLLVSKLSFFYCRWMQINQSHSNHWMKKGAIFPDQRKFDWIIIRLSAPCYIADRTFPRSHYKIINRIIGFTIAYKLQLLLPAAPFVCCPDSKKTSAYKNAAFPGMQISQNCFTLKLCKLLKLLTFVP